MQETNREYNKFEKDILMLLYNSIIELTTSEIAKELGISWATANKYLNVLYDENQLVKRGEGNRIYWMYWTQFMDLPDGQKEKWWDDEARAALNLPPIKRIKQATLEDPYL